MYSDELLGENKIKVRMRNYSAHARRPFFHSPSVRTSNSAIPNCSAPVVLTVRRRVAELTGPSI